MQMTAEACKRERVTQCSMAATAVEAGQRLNRGNDTAAPTAPVGLVPFPFLSPSVGSKCIMEHTPFKTIEVCRS